MEKNKIKAGVSLDEMDFAILNHLQNDGRTSFTIIADKLNYYRLKADRFVID